MTKKIISLLFAVLCVTAARAQWVDNVKTNTLISESGKLFCANSHAVEATNGNIFVSWVSFEIAGEEEKSNGMTKLQLLDKNGKALWKEGGIYISKNETASWGSDFSIAATPDNCVVIAFSDSRTDPVGRDHFRTYAYKIDQEGNFLWGLNGVAMPTTSDRCMRPQVCVTNAGSVIVGYSDSRQGGFVMNRIEDDGTLVWSETLKMSGTEGKFVSCDEDDFIVVVKGGEGSITAQRYDTYGEQIWSRAITNETVYGYVEHRVKSDGQDGAVISHMIETGTNEAFFVCLQRISAEGETMMGIKPIRTSNEMATHRGIAFGVDTKNESIVSVWEKVIGGMPTLCCTKVSYFGDEMWGENGVELDNDDMWGYRVEDVIPTEDDGYILLYRKSVGAVELQIIAQKLDKNGEKVWKKEMSDISYKNYCSVLPCEEQICIFWVDAKNSEQAWAGEVFGQNISYNGDLGIVTSIENTQATDANCAYYNNVNHTLNMTITDANTPVNIELYNLTGLLLNHYQNLSTNNGNLSIELEGLLSGTYIIRIVYGENQCLYGKIMVK